MTLQDFPSVDTPTIASAISMLAVVAKGWIDYGKDKKRDPALKRIESKVDAIDGRLDDMGARITKQEHWRAGVDGQNGAVSQLRDIETRLRRVEGL